MNDYNVKKIYEEMELHLISSMKRNLGRHLKDEQVSGIEFKMWQAEKLKELKRYQKENKSIVKFHTAGLSKEVADILKEEFKQGHKSEINKYNKLFDKKLSDSFFKLNDRKANALINVVNHDLDEANKAALRMMNDTYRQTVHKAATFASNGVMTQKQAVDMATKDFLSRGLAVIEYKDGKRVNIASYAQMAVRTASQRAMLMGEGEFRKSIGETNVIISKHGTACKLCVPHEGNVYIDDVYSGGKADGKYKLLSDAMKQGLFHPNCRHGISTYYGLDDEDDEETTVNVPAENNNEDAARLDREIQKEKRKVAGFQSPDNLKTAQQRLKELEDKKHDNVLAYYVSGEGMYINNALRGVNDVILNDNDMRYIKDLDNALNTKLKTNMTLYRNVDATAIFGNMSETDFENLESKLIYNTNDRYANAAADKYLKNIKSKVITDNGYLSTTKDYEIARDWGGFTGSDKPIVLELEVPKGTKGRDLAKFDLEDDPQKEVLLARNTKYKINDVIAKDGNIYVKASVINDDEVIPQKTVKGAKTFKLQKAADVEDKIIKESAIIKDLEDRKIEYKTVQKLKKKLTTDEIIAKIGGGDMTGGSCSSVAFAYIGNKNGLDVLDFRGGASLDYFSRSGNIMKIANIKGVKCVVDENYNDILSAINLLKTAEEGKEYYLSIADHASIIRKKDNIFEYLELQTEKNNGYKKLTNEILKKRFNCKQSHSVHGLKLKMKNVLIDVDSFKDNIEFEKILGYLNTATEKQIKGAAGYAK